MFHFQYGMFYYVHICSMMFQFYRLECSLWMFTIVRLECLWIKCVSEYSNKKVEIKLFQYSRVVPCGEIFLEGPKSNFPNWHLSKVCTNFCVRYFTRQGIFGDNFIRQYLIFFMNRKWIRIGPMIVGTNKKIFKNWLPRYLRSR